MKGTISGTSDSVRSSSWGNVWSVLYDRVQVYTVECHFFSIKCSVEPPLRTINLFPWSYKFSKVGRPPTCLKFSCPGVIIFLFSEYREFEEKKI